MHFMHLQGWDISLLHNPTQALSRLPVHARKRIPAVWHPQLLGRDALGAVTCPCPHLSHRARASMSFSREVTARRGTGSAAPASVCDCSFSLLQMVNEICLSVQKHVDIVSACPGREADILCAEEAIRNANLSVSVSLTGGETPQRARLPFRIKAGYRLVNGIINRQLGNTRLVNAMDAYRPSSCKMLKNSCEFLNPLPKEIPKRS